MDRSRHTEKLLGANQDSTSSSVAPEVLRTSGGADVPAVVALRAPLENLNSRKRSRMDRAQLTEKPLGANQDLPS